MPADVIWPREALPSASRHFNPAERSIAGPATNEGLGQVSASDAGVWKVLVDKAVVKQKGGTRGILLWDAIAGMLGGRTGTLLFPVHVTGRRPLPDGVTDTDINNEAASPHDDDSFFDDDSGYMNTWIEVSVQANAARRATTLILTKTLCGTIEPGMRFSIGERMYQVKRVTTQDSASATVVVNFPLREPVAAGGRCDFAWPVCLMRLMTDAEMDLDPGPEKIVFPSVRLVEAL